MTIITEAEATDFGISTRHEKMPNGELRFRLLSSDGSSYIRTESGDMVEWQNSHYHRQVKEMYIVQKGWMAFAEYIDNKLCLKLYYPGDFVISQPNIKHNVYLSPNSVIHTIKFGDTSSSDWNAASDFDEITKSLTKEDIIKLTSSCD